MSCPLPQCMHVLCGSQHAPVHNRASWGSSRCNLGTHRGHLAQKTPGRSAASSQFNLAWQAAEAVRAHSQPLTPKEACLEVSPRVGGVVEHKGPTRVTCTRPQVRLVSFGATPAGAPECLKSPHGAICLSSSVYCACSLASERMEEAAAALLSLGTSAGHWHAPLQASSLGSHAQMKPAAGKRSTTWRACHG